MKKYSLFAFYLLIGETMVRAFGFIVNAYLARVLEPAGFGLIAIGTSFLTGSLLISESGFRTLGLVETAKPPEQKTFSFSDILINRLIHTVIAFIILYGLIFLLYGEISKQKICALFLINIFYDALFLEWYYNGLQRFKTIAAARIGASILYITSIFYLVKSPDNVNYVPVLFFAANMVGVIILFILLPSTSVTFKPVFSYRKYLTILSHSLPLGIGTFLNQITVYLPTLMLGKFYSDHETGLYGAALKIVLLMMALDKIFSTIFLSSLPKMWHDNRENATANLQILLRGTITIGFTLALGLSVAAVPVITLVFGGKYSEGAPILSLLSWFFSLTLINSIFAFGLIATDNKKRYVKAAVVGFILNCAAIPLFTHFLRLPGAAVSAVAGELVFITLCFHQFRTLCPLSFYTPFLKACFASGIAWYITTITEYNLFLEGITAATLFFTAAVVLKIISPDDFRTLLQKWKQA